MKEEQQQKKTVLIVDDDQEMHETIEDALKMRFEVEVLTAEEPQQAIKLLVSRERAGSPPVDLIILDWHMPVGGGTIVTDGGLFFLKGCQTVVWPVLVYTSYPAFPTCVTAIQAGALDYICKNEPKEKEHPNDIRWGIGYLMKRCHEVLYPEPMQDASFPSPEWHRTNDYWLMQRFGGKWVTFAQPDKTDGSLEGEKRDGVIIIARESYIDLLDVISSDNALFRQMPQTHLIKEVHNVQEEGVEQ